MIFKKYAEKQLLKKEASYISIQQELETYRQMGIKEYTFLGGGCSVCTELNGKSFFVNDAKAGINLPPMHTGCKCTIKAKTKIDMFKDHNGVNPLKDNPKFEEWKRKQNNSV